MSASWQHTAECRDGRRAWFNEVSAEDAAGPWKYLGVVESEKGLGVPRVDTYELWDGGGYYQGVEVKHALDLMLG